MTLSDETRFDNALLRSTLGHFPTGVVAVTANSGAERVGMTLQSFVSLSLEPPLILLSVARTSSTWPRIRAAGRFVVNVLSRGQGDLARQFARSGADKFENVEVREELGLGGPVLEGALAWVDCELYAEHDGGDHLIIVGSVRDLQLCTGSDAELRPLVFHRSKFHSLAVP